MQHIVVFGSILFNSQQHLEELHGHTCLALWNKSQPNKAHPCSLNSSILTNKSSSVHDR
jgi:hypothetical protein